MTLRIERLDTVRCEGGENPLWDHRRKCLYLIDNTGRKAHRYDPVSGRTQSWTFPSVITTLVLREDGGAVVTLRSGIHTFDFDTGELALLHPLTDPPPYVYNDGKVDRRGRFVIGASTANFADPGPEGGLFRLDPDNSLTRLDSGIHFSNGPCWSPDGGTLYFSDSWINTIYAYDYDMALGRVSNRRVFANTSEMGGVPDGATVDADGRYWVALFRAAKIASYSPDGTLDRVIEMPVKLVSSLAFGGPDLDRLFVTTIAHDIAGAAQGGGGDTDEELAGSVFVIDGLGARGIAEPYFGG